MSGPAYYRAEAEKCRKLAAAGKDFEAKERWLQLADEYEQLAEAMETQSGGTQRPFMRVSMQQQQPVQQQQAKAEEPDKGE